MPYFKILLLVALALAGSAVFAQALPVGVSPVFAPTVTPGGFSYSGGVANAANAANLTFSNAANGPVYGRAVQKIALGGGATADIALASAPTGAAIAGALGRFALKATGVFAVGYALYDLSKELGFDFNKSGGALVITKPDLSVCTVGPCYTYTPPVGSPSSSLDAACRSAYSVAGGNTPSFNIQYSGSYVDDYGNAYCTGSYAYGAYNMSIPRTPIPVSVATPLPATVQDFTDAIANRSGWPSTSAINRAINDAIAAGEPIPLPQPSIITGPAAVPLSPSTVTNPDGSTVTKTPTKALTYSPPSVTVTETVTQTSTNAQGQPTGTTTSTAPAEMPETCGYPGGPPCKIDETGTPDKAVEKVYDPKADAVKESKDKGTATISGSTDKEGLFSGFAVLWSAPAVVACTPYVLPNFRGVSMGSLDPCPVVDGVRLIMSYMWAFAGLMMCIGFVREAIQGA